MAIENRSHLLLRQFSFAVVLCLSQIPIANADIANCEQANVQFESLKNRMSDGERTQVFSSIIKDIGVLRAELANKNSPQPGSLLRHCFDVKKKALGLALENGSSGWTASVPVKRQLAEYAVMIGSHKDAYENYLSVAEQDRKDYSSRENAFTRWLAFKVESMSSTNPKNITSSDLDTFLTESDRILKPLLDGKGCPQNVKARALSARAQLVETLFASPNRAQADWRAAADADPANAEASAKVASFEVIRGRPADARVYIERLLAQSKDSPSLNKTYLEILVQMGDYSTALEFGAKTLRLNPKDGSSHAYLARALISSGQYKQATIINTRALKLSSKNPYARSNASQLLKKEGDSLADKNLFGAALGKYEGALKFDPNTPELETKMAQIIFDYRKSENFLPKTPTLKDMKRVVELLAKEVETPEANQNSLEVFISAAGRSESPQQAVEVCARYMNLYGAPNDFYILLTCAKAFKQKGQSDKLSSLIEKARKNPYYKDKSDEVNKLVLLANP